MVLLVFVTPKESINFFVASHLADIAITKTAFTAFNSFQEIGVAGHSMLMDDETRMIIAKLAVTALIVGIYALTRGKKKEAEFVGRKVMNISLGIMYLVLVTNTAQVAYQLLEPTLKGS